jgi:hypothetical protein
MRYMNCTRLDDGIIRTEWDVSYAEGRQYREEIQKEKRGMNIEHTVRGGLNSVLEDQYSLFHKSSKRSLAVSCDLFQCHAPQTAIEFIEIFA